MVRRNHTIKFGFDIRREALDVLNPPNPTGSFTINTTGTNSSTATGGNASASLLLGQINALSIDNQKQGIQKAGHFAGVFLGEDRAGSNRVGSNFCTR